MNKPIFYLVKFFTEEAHVEQFLAGKLFLNRLSYFKKIEQKALDGRADNAEAVAMWWQPDNMLIKFHKLQLELTSKDLAGPVKVSMDYHNHLHIFCMYALYEDGFKTEDGVTEYPIDRRCFEFGEYAVMTQALPFINQVHKYCMDNNIEMDGNSVEYYDEKTFHGEIPLKEIPFRKQKRFEYQSEFRFCFNTKTKGDNPITLDIGSIGAFSSRI